MAKSHFIACALAFCCATSFAAETAPPTTPDTTVVKASDEAGQLWINGGMMSHHFWRGGHYNERNWGFGAEYKLGNDLAVTAGFYRNSVRHHTDYAALTWLPLSVGPLKIGGSAGVMNGYPTMLGGRWFFAALPVVSIEGERFGANLIVVPSVGKVDGCIGLQIKIRVM